ncbi:hypothetical protein N9R81_01570 [Flavobacteriales bacterium]|nr:hypothetical protein [Flavobacteriales bacterium]
MKAATIHELKRELKNCSQNELLEHCLRLSKFKKDNKELLTYLVFEAEDEFSYIESVKNEIDDQFTQVNKTGYYLIKKSVRKILRNVKKYIRYSGKKETEVELLLHFCRALKSLDPSYTGNTILLNTYIRQVELIKKSITNLDEDLQYDYNLELEDLHEL